SWGDSQVIVNSNELFWRYDGVDGGKTGYNDLGKNTAITTVTRNGQRLICVVLDSPQQYEDSAKVLDYAFNNFRLGLLVSKGQPLKRVSVGDESVDLVSKSDFYYTYPVGENYIKDIVYSGIGQLSPPLTTGDEVGSVKYILKDGTEIDIKLYPGTDVYSSVSFLSVIATKMIEYKELSILLCILAFVEIMLIVYSLIKIVRNAVFKLIHNFRN
ncbi:MAG: D-alanyl-D-alanine carboxypeptidase, partial [Clostridiaceae bacterium]|nr:D-alanyl-D-alanine carboxypeptidase [Clostridiaceae bacterium]